MITLGVRIRKGLDKPNQGRVERRRRRRRGDRRAAHYLALPPAFLSQPRKMGWGPSSPPPPPKGGGVVVEGWVPPPFATFRHLEKQGGEAWRRARLSAIELPPHDDRSEMPPGALRFTALEGAAFEP